MRAGRHADQFDKGPDSYRRQSLKKFLELLHEPRPLTSIDRRRLSRVFEFGADALDRAGRSELARFVSALGEHWSGNGRPAGLSHGAIPIEARIVAAADAFDTIAYARSYRPPDGTICAALELIRTSAVQFDPEVVRNLLEVVPGAATGDLVI